MTPQPPAPPVVDLTGLPESVVQQILRLVAGARQEVGTESPLPLPHDEWLVEYAAAKQAAMRRADRYPVGHVLDDSRDTIYGDRDRL